jgi:lipopolysaccharide export LptBFGC system permease protein LptF
MKRWRGEPDHDHWQKMPQPWFTPAALAGLGAVIACLALATAYAGRTGCETGGRLLCSTVRLVSSALGVSVLSVEIGAWGVVAVILFGMAWLRWTRRAR